MDPNESFTKKKMSGIVQEQELKIESVEDIIQLIRKLSGSNSINSPYWYRGHADIDWKLLPAVLRQNTKNSPSSEDVKKNIQSAIVSLLKKIPKGELLNIILAKLQNNRWDKLAGEIERNIRFFQWAYPHIQDRDNQDRVAVYFISQHYGLPTRLLDWSLNPLVALYFACEQSGETKKKDGSIFILDTSKLKTENKEECGFSAEDVSAYRDWEGIFDFDNFVKGMLFGIGWTGKKLEIPYPPITPIVPKRVTERIVAQSSRFTFHPPIIKNIKTQEEPDVEIESIGNGFDQSSFTKYRISQDRKREIQKELILLGVHRFSLFPDLDNLTKHIKIIESLND